MRIIRLSIKEDLPFWILFVVSSFLLLKGLGNSCFWQDEGHGAVLGERILQYGYPRVWDGRNLLTGMDGLDFNKDYALTWDGWLPYYLVAGSFALLGESTATGRLPFVFSALLTLLLLYFLVRRLTGSKLTAFFSVFFLVFSIMFLLHSRQCRYYALLPLGVVVSFWGITQLPSRWGIFWTTLGLFVLYHSNLVSFGTFYLSLLFLPRILGWNKEKVRSFIISSLWVVATTLPMFLYAQMWNKPDAHDPISWNRYIGTILGNLVLLNKFYVPLLLLLLGYFLFKKKGTESNEFRLFESGLVILYVPVVLICFVLGPNVRYLYHLFPITSFLAAFTLVGIYQSKKKAGLLLFSLILFTHALDFLPFKIPLLLGDLVRRLAPAPLPGWIRYVQGEYASVDDEEGPSQLAGIYRKLPIPPFGQRFWRTEYRSYWDEISHPFPDNLLKVVQYLKEHRLPEEGVFMNVDQFPMIFYYPEIRIVYTMTGPPVEENEKDPIGPEQWEWESMTWFVFRPFEQTRGPFLTEKEFVEKVEEKGWKVVRHDLGIPSYYWGGNWPERYRLYRSLHGNYGLPPSNHLVIYQIDRS